MASYEKRLTTLLLLFRSSPYGVLPRSAYLLWYVQVHLVLIWSGLSGDSPISADSRWVTVDELPS